MVSKKIRPVPPSFIQFLEDSNNYAQTIENLKHLALPPEVLAQYINFMQTAPISIVFIDSFQKILFTNKTLEYKLQKSQKELVGKPLSEVLTIHLTEEDQQEILLEVTENDHWSGTFSYINEDNQYKKVWLKVSRFHHPTTSPTIGILFFDNENINFRDFHEHSLNYYDAKTFLPNFNQLSFDLNRLIQKRDRTNKGLALIRCQNLSEITAYYSRNVMDEVTLTMIRRIKKILPKGFFLYRLSRDVFALFSSGLTDEHTFSTLIDTIYHALLEPLEFEGNQIFLTNEIGVALYPSQVKEVKDLLLSAEICLNQRDTTKVIYYSEEINRDYTFTLQTIEKLQVALEKDQITILYKPIVNYLGEIKAAEALIHWEDPELGTISSVDLLKGVKEYGHVNKLTAWILHKVAQDQLFHQLSITIKLNAAQITDAALLCEIKKHLENQTLDAAKIVFEITEHEDLNRCPFAMNTLRQLKNDGFRLGIDDFGVGYSDLALLTAIDFDVIKVDASFITGVTQEPKKEIILKHILLLAKELHLITCFKGITTKAERDCAAAIGSDCLQGPYFSDPLTPDQLLHKYFSVK
ncbi:EAL domain-containing protein [Enterococcus sp. LJL98]